MNKGKVAIEFYCLVLNYNLTKGKAEISEIPIEYFHDKGSKFSSVEVIIEGAVSPFCQGIRDSTSTFLTTL